MTSGPLLKHFPAYQMLDRGPLAVSISRLSDGYFLFANEAFLKLTGYGRQEVIGVQVGSLPLWNDPDARAQMVAAVQRVGYKHNLLIDLRRKSGEVIQVLGTAQVIEMEDGPHILTLLNDLREGDGYLGAHAAMREDLDFVEVAGKIGFWHVDSPDGRLHWSHGMEEIYGLPKGSFAGTVDDFFQRVHPADRAHNLEQRQRAILSGKPFDFRYRILRADGAVRWVVSRGSARCSADGTLLGAAGIQMDITEEVEREQQMRLQAQVMKNMAEGVVLVAADSGNIVYTNPRFDSMLGYAPGQLLGQPVAVLNSGSETEAQTLAHAIMSELQAQGEWRGELKNRCADGREIWVSATVSELDHEGLGKVWVAVHADINDRRLAQDARDDALDQLRRLSLNIQDSIEAERLEVSRELHDELGAALTGLRMRLESLAGRVQAGGAVQGAELLALADTARNTQLAAREICTRLRPPMLDDIGLLEACRWYLDDWSERVGIQVRSRFGKLGGEPDARLATDMFRVMQELLTNVARHSAATEVQVVLCHGPRGFVLRVRDNGHGFAPEQASLGFGLIGVQERVRQHAGQFRLKAGTSGSTLTVSMQNGVAL